MSNYHYDDRSSCGNCLQTIDYLPLKGTTYNECGPSCIDRNNKERSVKDKMYFDHFVLGQPWNLQPYRASNEWRQHTYSENQNL